jgi:hypothetical protein
VAILTFTIVDHETLKATMEWTKVTLDRGIIGANGGGLGLVSNDAPPHSLKDSNASSKVKTMEEERVGVCFLTCNIFGIKGHVGAMGWELGRVTSKLIIHTDVHKLNNKLISAWLEHFCCTNKPWAYMDS